MRRKRKSINVNKSKARNKKRWFGIAVLIVVFVAVFLALLYRFLPSKWDGKSRLVVAMPQQNRDVVVAVFDPDSRSIVHFTFPANTQVTASRNLGTWKLGSIWELARAEKVGGSLLAESIMKTFAIPVDGWINDPGSEVLKGRFSLSLESNLSLVQKLQLMAFSLTVNKGDKYEIDLVNSSYLRKTTLVSGEEGYISSPELPLSVLSYLADPVVSKLRIRIIDESTSSVARDLSRVINVLGGKVLNIKDEKQNMQTDCEVRAMDTESGKRLASLFSCSLKAATNSSFDLEIIIGGAFSKRF